LPLSQLDSNFSTAITIGNTAVVLGDTITTINNLTLGNVAITSVSTAFPNGYLANSNVIVGTTTLTLGSTVTSINGLSLSNVTISSGNVTISNVTTTNVTATTANVTTANVGTLTVIGNATIGGNATVTGNVTATKLIPTGTSVTGNGLYLPAANALGLSTNGTNAVYIDSSQNVGIGTSSPAYKLDVNGSAIAQNYLLNSTAATIGALSNTNIEMATSADATPRMIFRVNGNTERMRIDSSGNLLVSKTATGDNTSGFQTGAGRTSVTRDGATVLFATRLTSDGEIVGLYKDNTQVGAIGSASGGMYLGSGSSGAERMRIDTVGNAYIETGLLWQYAPTPTTKAVAATLTAAELATDIITLTGTTYTITLPTGTALDTYYTGVPAVNIGYDFHIVNTASGIITIAVGASGMTSVGLLTVAATVSAHFRLRRTAANTYILYRLS
jgi:hypothetical protein